MGKEQIFLIRRIAEIWSSILCARIAEWYGARQSRCVNLRFKMGESLSWKISMTFEDEHSENVESDVVDEEIRLSLFFVLWF